jgi:penicillin-binding protein 2
MYHRRLRLLAGILGVIMVALLVQAVRLTVLQGAAHRATAEARLTRRQWLPTWRGDIVDRAGRVLAQDQPRWEVAVSWDAITGQWAEDKATSQARRDLGSAVWQAASPEVRAAAIAARRGPYDEILERLWQEVGAAGGLDQDELDGTLNAIRSRVQHMAAVVWDQQRRRHEARFGAGEGPAFVPRPIREQAGAHVIVPDLRDGPAASLEIWTADYPELLSLRYARHRAHPQAEAVVEVDLSTLPGPLQGDGVRAVRVDRPGGQLVGKVRSEVWEEDRARRPFRDAGTGEVDRGGYRTDDIVGSSGVERSQEDVLRGDVGEVLHDHDLGVRDRVAPKPGRPVHLTIDTDLQARLEAVLDPSIGLTRVQSWHENAAVAEGTQLPASVVVLEIETGEIVAMASTPTAAGDLPASERAALQPWLVRGAQVVAPPGSIVKPLVLAAAVTEGVVAVEDELVCRGHHFEDQPGMARCWIYRPRYGLATHGRLGAVEALARSCNCWFYELGERMGLARLSDWLGRFGLGEPLDIGLTPSWSDQPVEVRGTRPREEEVADLRRSGEATFESVMLGIGQGRTAWTPLHAADAYATLARHGRCVPPTLVRGHRGAATHQGRPLSPAGVAAALEGLEDVVSESWGTGHHLSLPTGRAPIFGQEGVRIAAKTGTAQAPPWHRDVDGDGMVQPGERLGGVEHAWVVLLVGPEGGDFRYAVAVLVEYGGSGGRAAGPIADQVVRALKETGLLEQSP